MKKSFLVALLAVAFGLTMAACSPKSTSPVGPDCTKDKTDVRCQGGN